MTISDAAVFLRDNDGYLILTHRHPDGDTLGTAAGLCLALRSIGKDAYVAKNPEVVGRFERLVNHLTPPEDFIPRTVISADTATAALFPKAYEELAKMTALSIDHHPGGGGFAKNLLLDTTCAATGELAALLLNEMGIEISKDIAYALFIAIITDTGCFRYECTTSRTLRVAADLKDTGLNTAEIITEFFETKTFSRLALESELLGDIEYDGKIAIIFLTLEKIKITNASYDDIDGISSLPREIAGVEIGITLREENDGTTKVSLRTNTNYSASDICSKLGGGGHARAAGCLVKRDMSEARAEILNAVHELYPEL